MLIGQFIVLLMCIGYIDYIYYVNIYPDKRAKESFLQTSCSLVGKKLSKKGHVIHSYRSDFLINYTVNQTRYARWVSGNGLDMAFTSNQVGQEAILSQFDVGRNYVCWYDPGNPQIAMLVQRHTWMSTLPLMFPSIISVITLYYFLKNLLILMGSARVKTRDIVRARKQRKQKKGD